MRHRQNLHITFTGTGTFIVRLLQSGLIKPEDLQRKFRHELHANEIVLLAYYVAAVNIEATYHGLLPAGDTSPYEPFPGIVLTDTFQSSEDDDRYDDHGIFGDNNARVKAQNALDIRVIVGNPPYSAGQESGNDNNQNLKYKSLDARIAATYAAESTAVLKNSLYDSYIRSIRWASDRIKDRGIVAFVSNGGFIDGNTADGLRKSLTAEFSSLYIFNLRGNGRTTGEERRKEKDGVFGEGSRATIAIAILVKNPTSTTNGQLHYRDIGDYLSRQEKLTMISRYGTIGEVPWATLTPNPEGDWLNQRDTVFGSFMPMAEKATPTTGLFKIYSSGLNTSRDAWVYNSSRVNLDQNISNMISFYNKQVDSFAASGKTSIDFNQVIDFNPRKFSWSRPDKPRVLRGQYYEKRDEEIRTATYRPFNKQHVYFDRLLNDTAGKLPQMFPTAAKPNVGFYYVGVGSAVPFSVLMVDTIPDRHVTGAGSGGSFFSRFTYQPNSTVPTLFGDEEMFTRVGSVRLMV